MLFTRSFGALRARSLTGMPARPGRVVSQPSPAVATPQVPRQQSQQAAAQARSAADRDAA